MPQHILDNAKKTAERGRILIDISVLKPQNTRLSINDLESVGVDS